MVIGAGAAEPDRSRCCARPPSDSKPCCRTPRPAQARSSRSRRCECRALWSSCLPQLPVLPRFSSGPPWSRSSGRGNFACGIRVAIRRFICQLWGRQDQECAMRSNKAAARADDRTFGIAEPIAERVAALDWSAMANELDAHGCAVTPPLLTGDECEELAGLYPADAPFRSRVIMARHGFGRGEYKYFAYPLPDQIAELAHRALSAARRNRQPLERGDGHRGALSGGPPRLSRPLPQGRPAEAHAAAAAIRPRRLQLPAPGPLRRARVSVAGNGAAVAAGRTTFTAANSC